MLLILSQWLQGLSLVLNLSGAALFGRRCLSFTIDDPSSVEYSPAAPENERSPYHPSPTWQSAFRLR